MSRPHLPRRWLLVAAGVLLPVSLIGFTQYQPSAAGTPSIPSAGPAKQAAATPAATPPPPQASPPRAPLPAAFSQVESGEQKQYVTAKDEVVFRSRDGQERAIAFAPVSTNEELEARVSAESVKQPDGRVFPVVYADGAERNIVTRRLVTNEIRMKWTSAADPVVEGAVQVRRLDYAPEYVIVEMPDSFAAMRTVEQLSKQADGTEPEVLLAKMRVKRALPNDPFLGNQWHLKFQGQSGARSGTDINVEGAWGYGTAGGVKGAGVRVGIIDDGLETGHPDLAANVDTANDKDWNGNDDNANPGFPDDDHGTSCAGNVAAVGNNRIGVAGSAPQANLIGMRLISGSITDAQEAEAMAYLNNSTSGINLIHVKNNSWGPDDTGTELGPAGPLTLAAFQNATTTGRSGRGTIILWAGGNGGVEDDNSNYDGYANSIYTIAIGAFDSESERADYSEPGANIVVVAPSDGRYLGITTVDRSGSLGYNDGSTDPQLTDANYTSTFGGTSSATPTAAGVVALMLERNPLLGWRDVQEILIRSATRVNPSETTWATNGAGLRFNHNYGAGLVNATAAVTMAATWTNLPTQTSANSTASSLALPIPENSVTGVSRDFTISAANLRVEHVTLKVGIAHTARGNLEITLRSPSGMVSRLAEVHDDQNNNFNWTFMTVRNWGESAAGVWRLTVADRSGTGNTNGGTLGNATLTVFGSSLANPAPVVTLTSPANNASFTQGTAVTLSASATDTTASGAAGTISRVEFLSGAAVIGTDTTSPYSITWTPPTAGNYNLQARAVDSENASGLSSIAAITVVNQPPTITAAALTPSGTAYADQSLAVSSITASDPELAPITFTYQWQSSVDSGTFTIATGSTSATLPAADSNGGKRWRCVVTPSDGTQQGLPFTTAQVLVVARPLMTVASGQSYAYLAVLPLSGSPAYRFGTGNQGPAGLAINASTGQISGVVTGPAGAYTVVVERVNGQDQTVSFSYVLTVTPAPIPTFSTWIQGYPGLSNITPSGNADGDALPNLMEYAFGSNPSLPDGANATTITASMDSLTISYQLAKSTTGITNSVQWSTDLVTWSTLNVSFAADQDLGTQILRTATIPRSGRPRLFMRVVITQQ